MSGSSGGPASAEVYRIDWKPGDDTLYGVCHCGAEHRDTDPVRMWEWMLAHPRGHSTDRENDTGEHEHG
ncbi:MAG: hypothetical protein AUG49_20030 [Catenulispora sp. 13_1_20CM_3_70_7]|jgi:hypothetical protein|nr:MAG: hypothetical protein AUG49_20030 [Catenulispora sp. 13_1_20CM_3_70_7]